VRLRRGEEWRDRRRRRARAYLDSRRIARQKVPERVELVVALPRTQTGKIQKYVLREEIRTRLAAEAAGDASGS